MFVSIIASLLGLSAILLLGRFAEKRARMFAHSELVKQLIYQPSALLAVGSLFLWHRLYVPENSRLSFSGNLDASIRNFEWLGIDASLTWSTGRLLFAFFPALLTTLVVYLQLLRGKKISWKFLWVSGALAVIFSVTNSLTEEIVFRFIAVEGLQGHIQSTGLALLCGVWFGIPHYFGSPGRIPGVLMAGFLGWVLAWAAIETQGIATSWFIHFVQDLPIFTMIFLQSFSNRAAFRQD